MVIIDDLLNILSDYSTSYKTLRRRLFAMPSGKQANVKEETIKVFLSRLKKMGLVENQ